MALVRGLLCGHWSRWVYQTLPQEAQREMRPRKVARRVRRRCIVCYSVGEQEYKSTREDRCWQ